MYVCHWKFALSLLVLVCTLQVLQVQGSSVNGVDRDFAVRQYDYAVIRLTRVSSCTPIVVLSSFILYLPNILFVNTLLIKII